MFYYGKEVEGGGREQQMGKGVASQRYFGLCFILGFHCVLPHFVAIFRSISLNRSRIANEWRVNTIKERREGEGGMHVPSC